MLPINNLVSYHGFTLGMLTKIVGCHEDMTGKRGENVMGMSMNATGMSILLSL